MNLYNKNMSNRILLAFGGNIPSHIGNVVSTIQLSIDDLRAWGITILSSSRVFQTPCFPVGAGPNFVNAAVMCQTELSPHAVLEILHSIEAKYGRERRERWGQRTLDIDLLAMDDQILPDLETFSHWRDIDHASQQTDIPQELILPHPRMQDRAFVLVPLAEVAPEWRHPVLGQTVVEMLAKLPESDIAGIVPLLDQ